MDRTQQPRVDSQSRCLKRALVTLCPWEALSPPGIWQVFLNLNLVHRWENQGSKTAAGDHGRSQTCLSNEEEFLSSYKSGKLKFMTDHSVLTNCQV